MLVRVKKVTARYRLASSMLLGCSRVRRNRVELTMALNATCRRRMLSAGSSALPRSYALLLHAHRFKPLAADRHQAADGKRGPKKPCKSGAAAGGHLGGAEDVDEEGALDERELTAQCRLEQLALGVGPRLLGLQPRRYVGL
jgi:hypothetical protein